MALDQDRASIAELRRCYGHIPALIPLEASAGRMIVRPLVFAHFCTGVPDYGVMHAFMAWRLILPDEPEMQRLLDELPATHIARTPLLRGTNCAVIDALVEQR
jgi:hypothetical protein